MSRYLVPIALAAAATMTTAFARQGGASKPTSQGGAAKGDFSQGELDQMLAPIALYPDSVLSQILMATTYPIEIVQADRWVKAHKDLKGDAAAKALEQETWDPSVKSLVNFPDVLAMLSAKLDWTQKLGDAFIADSKAVMDAVQRLRAKAKDAGKLDSTKEQKVTVESSGTTEVIKIESSDPKVIYVPTYDTTVVYGAWPYPAYPPYPYYPPGYAPGSTGLAFGVGITLGLAWGYAWGSCNWGHSDIDIDVNKNVNFNNNIDRNKYKTDLQNRTANRDGRGTWQHDPSHRGNVGYRDSASAQRYGGKTAAETSQARDAFRGRAEEGRRDIAAGGADAVRNRAGGASGVQNRAGSGSLGNRDGALQGIDRGGVAARADSARGRSSLSSGGARSGGARAGGGMRGGRR